MVCVRENYLMYSFDELAFSRSSEIIIPPLSSEGTEFSELGETTVLRVVHQSLDDRISDLSLLAIFH